MEEKKDIHPVVKGSIGKESVGNKLSNNILASDGNSVKNYIFKDILIPAAKDTIINMVTGGLKMAFWGDSRQTSSNSGSSMYRNYNGISNPSNASYYVGDRRPRYESATAVHRSVYDYQNIEFATKGDAEMALDALSDAVAQYGMASVQTLYEIAGLAPNNTDSRWGWTDLSEASSYRYMNGLYRLHLPRVQQLD
jgi:hypothetical protein